MTRYRVVLIAPEGAEGWWRQSILAREAFSLRVVQGTSQAFDVIVRDRPDLFILDERGAQLLADDLLAGLRRSVSIPSLKGILVSLRKTPDMSRSPVATILVPPLTLDTANAAIARVLAITARAGRRHMVKTRVSLDPANARWPLLVTSLSINRGGMLIESTKPLPTGRECMLAFHGAPELSNLVLAGTVVREEQRPQRASRLHCYVVRFKDPAHRDLMKLEAFLTSVPVER